MTKERVIERLLIRSQKYDTQKDAAIALNVHPSYLSDVLKGRRDPSVALLEELGIERFTGYREMA